jgi:hypothetical protein
MVDDMGERVGSENPVPVLAIRDAVKVRIVGRGFDVALAMITEEDFEIVERILAKARAALRRGNSL